MAKVLRNPSVADLLKAIKEEDAGLTPKLNIRHLPKMPTSVVVGSTEVVAMQMAVSECNRLASIVSR